MFLKRTNDRMTITTVVRIPMTVDMPMKTRLTMVSDRLNISHELQLGLQTPLTGSRKKLSRQIKPPVILLSSLLLFMFWHLETYMRVEYLNSLCYALAFARLLLVCGCSIEHNYGGREHGQYVWQKKMFSCWQKVYSWDSGHSGL